MKNFWTKTLAAFAAAKIAFQNPQICTDHNLQNLAPIHGAISKTIASRTPQLTFTGFIMPPSKEQCVVSVWIGYGTDSNPVKEMETLYEENRRLKIEVGELLKARLRLIAELQLALS